MSDAALRVYRELTTMHAPEEGTPGVDALDAAAVMTTWSGSLRAGGMWRITKTGPESFTLEAPIDKQS